MTQCFPLYRYDEIGNRIENITDWGVEQFVNQYPQLREIPLSGVRGLLFHYVYAVLHNPAYRKKYEQNLKRDFPRIPFYDDFEQWAAWGKALMELHINYEEAGTIEIDEQTTLTGVPTEAWPYKLGNRSALEWILD